MDISDVHMVPFYTRTPTEQCLDRIASPNFRQYLNGLASSWESCAEL